MLVLLGFNNCSDKRASASTSKGYFGVPKPCPFLPKFPPIHNFFASKGNCLACYGTTRGYSLWKAMAKAPDVST